MAIDHTGQSLTSIASCPKRGEGGSNRYRGNCSLSLIKDLIRCMWGTGDGSYSGKTPHNK